jgi:hypothetical protein
VSPTCRLAVALALVGLVLGIVGVMLSVYALAMAGAL